jgi:general secretion pathway protein F
MSETALTTFHFKAGTPEGELFAGTLAAESESEALRLLRRQGFTPIRVATTPVRPSLLHREIGAGGPRQIRVAEAEWFCRELRILLVAGIELIDGLSLFTTSLPARSRVRGFALAVRHWLRMGSSFSAAIARSGYRVPDNLVPIIRAGEQTGSLAPALGMLAATYSDHGRFSRLLTGALIYPAFLLATAMAVLAIIAFFVAPNLAALFRSMDKPVPDVIAALDGVARLAAGQPLLVIAALGGLAIVAATVSASPAARRALWRAAFVAPGIGTALQWATSRRFAATLRLYLATNVALVVALPNALAAAGVSAGASTVALADEIRSGGTLAAALEHHARLPAKVLHLVRIGESSGKLAEALDAVAEEAGLRFEKQMAVVTALLAPLLIVAVGAIVGGIILTVFTALMDINDLASI